MTICPMCRQPLDCIRYGVRLSPLKARIFDMVKRSQHVGVTSENINALCFDGRSTPTNVRVHIAQINAALVDTGLHISGGADGWRGNYHLVRTAATAKRERVT